MIKMKLAAIVGTAALAAALASAGPACAAAAASVRPLTLSAACPFSSAQNSLVEGDSGADVEQAQCELNHAFAFGSPNNYGNGGYYGLSEDGSFGAETLAATKAFQKCAGSSVDGEIGPDTWSELNYWMSKNVYC